MSLRSIPDLFLERAQSKPDTVSCYEKVGSCWVGRTWRDGEEAIRETSAGLAGLGVGHGDRVAILSGTRTEWSTADMAILSRGAIVVGIYPTCTVEQTRYHIEHSGARVAFVEDMGQFEKLRAAAEGIEGELSCILFDGPEDADAADAPPTLDAFRAAARSQEEATPEAFAKAVAAVGPDDVGTIIYTSGTTGPPKGAVLTHGNMHAAIQATSDLLPTDSTDVTLAFLPLAHSLQRQANYAGLLRDGVGAYCSSLDKVLDEFAEIRPTVQASVPRIWEKFHTKVHARIEAASPARRRIARWALGTADRHGRLRRAGATIPAGLSMQYRLADRLVFKRLRAVFGGRVKFMLSGGAPIAIEILEFFDNLGIRIYEGWGLTETAAPATINHPGSWRFGTVGKPIPGVRVRIAEDGEVEVDGPNVFQGYYQDETATKAAFTEDGWFRTGDIGEIDDDGFLKITDRKKDIIITSGGKNVAPQNIENLIKSDPLVSQAMVVGDRRKYLTAIITLDPEEAAEWASRRGHPDDPALLAAHADMRGHVQAAVDRANAQLARYETVKRFEVVDREFTEERGEITPTLKLKRRVVAQSFAESIERMYAE